MDLFAQLDLARIASRKMALLSTTEKNEALLAIAEKLRERQTEILAENEKDMAEAAKEHSGAVLDRLLLTSERIETIVKDTEKVADLSDFVGKILSEHHHENGMKILHQRVPMGVIAMIYEFRPNVTVDSAVLALKSGNAVVLKGGKEAAHSNRILVQIMREALQELDIDPEALQLLDGATHEDVGQLMTAKGKVDLLIPRGGKGLIQFVCEHATVPYIESGASPVHVFVDESADLEMAAKICVNGKVRRISVCNSLDTILVHEQIYSSFLPFLLKKLEESQKKKQHPAVRIHADEKAGKVLSSLNYEPLEKLQTGDYETEWLDYVVSVGVVKDLDAALLHLQSYSLGHSESIVTENAENAQRFLTEVDAACVYHNVSPSFTDGAQFGLGAEVAISTQKLHARGPFALEALTTTKWVVTGEGQVRE